MTRILLHALGLLTIIGAACKVPPPPLPVPGERPLHDHPAVGCWELAPAHGHSTYLPGTVRIRLDTVLVQPDSREALMQVHLDSITITRMIGNRRIFIAQWSPYRRGDRIFLFWGDGLTGLDMRLRVRGNRMEGPSANTTDVFLDHDGPDVVGRRVACDS